jgi:dCMP deaminase
MLGATIYMACINPADGKLIPDSTSCSMCRRQIINAGIKKIVIRDTPTEYRVVDVQKEWVEVDDSLPADN